MVDRRVVWPRNVPLAMSTVDEEPSGGFYRIQTIPVRLRRARTMPQRAAGGQNACEWGVFIRNDSYLTGE